MWYCMVYISMFLADQYKWHCEIQFYLCVTLKNVHQLLLPRDLSPQKENPLHVMTDVSSGNFSYFLIVVLS